MSMISILSLSPGIAPLTATGPVRMCTVARSPYTPLLKLSSTAGVLTAFPEAVMSQPPTISPSVRGASHRSRVVNETTEPLSSSIAIG